MLRRIVALLVVFASLSILSAVYAQAPLQGATPTPVKCTEKGASEATSINFVNYRSRPVSIFWIDYDCKEKFYKTLGPGESYSQPTYVGHLWQVRDQETNAAQGQPFAASSSAPATFRVGNFPKLADKAPCSPSDEMAAVTLTFVNYTSRPVVLYWVDQSCELKPYATLEAGQFVEQATFVKHSWLVRDDEAKTRLVQFAAEDTTNRIVPVGVSVATPGKTCSSDGATALDRKFYNSTSRKMTLVLVDQNCKETPYATAEPGQTLDVKSADGYVWRWYDAENKLLTVEFVDKK